MGRLDDPNFVAMLQKMQADNKEAEFFDAVYDALAENEPASVADILSEPGKYKVKMRQVKAMKKRYERLEEYEKCAALQRIISACMTRHENNGEPAHKVH